MAETYDVKLTTSADTRALEQAHLHLQQLVDTARQAGAPTRELEKQLASVNRQMGQNAARAQIAAMRSRRLP